MQPHGPTILIIVGGVSANQREVALGAHACAQVRGWSVVFEQLVSTEMLGPDREARARGRRALAPRQEMRSVGSWIRDWRPQAALMVFCEPAVVAHAAKLIPTVAAMSYTGGLAIPSVDVDQTAVATLAGEHLMSLGLHRFAVLGSWTLRWAVERARAFEKQVTSAGFSCNVCDGNVLHSNTMFASSVSRAAMGKWLRSLEMPVGILACTDRWGMHLVHHCHAMGIRVPEDASVVSVDNDAMTCRMSESPLSSVAINWQQIGYDAAALAGRLAEGEAVEPVRTLVGPVGVVRRQSSDLLAVDDPDVAAVMRVIHQHADRPITVAELLKKIPVHRNRLERRFRNLVGRRILDEVRRVHVERAKELLISTDLPMPDVAQRSGFPNASMLAIAFRRETGRTPTQFRGQFRLRQ